MYVCMIPSLDTLTSTAVIVGAVGALIVITVVNILVVGLAVCLIYRKVYIVKAYLMY